MTDAPVSVDDPTPILTEPTLGERALAVAQAERVEGHRADGSHPDASSVGARVRAYFAPCVRLFRPRGRAPTPKLLGLTSGNWCAAFASWAFYTALFEEDHGLGVVPGPGDLEAAALAWEPSSTSRPPFGYRAAVAELVADARASGTWVDVAEVRADAEGRRLPRRGDLLVFSRAGEDPRTGGEGHVVIVEAEGGPDDTGNVADAQDVGGSWVVVSGNAPGGVVARETRTLADVAEAVVGFVAVR